jgi:hypothetical protein
MDADTWPPTSVDWAHDDDDSQKVLEISTTVYWEVWIRFFNIVKDLMQHRLCNAIVSTIIVQIRHWNFCIQQWYSEELLKWSLKRDLIDNLHPGTQIIDFRKSPGIKQTHYIQYLFFLPLPCSLSDIHIDDSDEGSSQPKVPSVSLQFFMEINWVLPCTSSFITVGWAGLRQMLIGPCTTCTYICLYLILCMGYLNYRIFAGSILEYIMDSCLTVRRGDHLKVVLFWRVQRGMMMINLLTS